MISEFPVRSSKPSRRIHDRSHHFPAPILLPVTCHRYLGRWEINVVQTIKDLLMMKLLHGKGTCVPAFWCQGQILGRSYQSCTRKAVCDSSGLISVVARFNPTVSSVIYWSCTDFREIILEECPCRKHKTAAKCLVGDSDSLFTFPE